MRADITPHGIVIRLSRRNITALLHMLDTGRTTGALTARDNHTELVLIPEEDDAHYHDRAPGDMSWERPCHP